MFPSMPMHFCFLGVEKSLIDQTKNTNDSSIAIAKTTTDAMAIYSFDSLGAGSYRISITDIASWYTLLLAWNGAMNESGALIFPNAQNVADPETQIGWLHHRDVPLLHGFCMV
jgi:hypothetical protein